MCVRVHTHTQKHTAYTRFAFLKKVYFKVSLISQLAAAKPILINKKHSHITAQSISQIIRGSYHYSYNSLKMATQTQAHTN